LEAHIVYLGLIRNCDGWFLTLLMVCVIAGDLVALGRAIKHAILGEETRKMTMLEELSSSLVGGGLAALYTSPSVYISTSEVCFVSMCESYQLACAMIPHSSAIENSHNNRIVGDMSRWETRLGSPPFPHAWPVHVKRSWGGSRAEQVLCSVTYCGARACGTRHRHFIELLGSGRLYLLCFLHRA
jgi:hypothetical protein